MKRIPLISVLLVVWLVACPGCQTIRKAGKATTNLFGGDDPSPESEWNRERTWKKIGETPPSYVPYLYEGTPGADGEWLIDERDGKRFFIPKEELDGLSPTVLRAEAYKALELELP